MAFDDSLANDVLKHADIVKVVSAYLPVIRKGKDYLAKCPFHDDTNPSMHISPELQIFKCFVCGTSGNAIGFVRKYEHLSFREAMKKVAEICDYHDPRLDDIREVKVIDPRRTPLVKCLHDLTVYYQYALNSPEGKVGLDYFNERHLDADLRSKFMLGYAFKDGKATCRFLEEKGHSLKTIEDTGVANNINGVYADRNQGRVIFPIFDTNGEVVGFSARRIGPGPEAKYVNSPETYLFHKSNILYNFHNAKEKARIAGYIYVLEGFMDVFALYRIGMESCVATMGTALTAEHIRLLRSLNVEIRLCLDGDAPGQSAMMKISKALSKAGLNYRIVDNQGSSKDPDEILNEDGKVALEEYLNKLISQVDFALNYYLRTNPLKTNEEKKTLIKEFLPILVRVNSQIELDTYLRKLEKITGFDIESIRSLVKRTRLADGNNDIAANKAMIENFHPERKALQKLITAERELLYQMSQNKSAVAFYEQKVPGFYDDVYRAIANYIIDYASSHDQMSESGLMSLLEESDIDNKQQLINDLTSIYMETHPKECTDDLLNNLLDTMNSERNRISDEDVLSQSLEGKSELEKARIISDYNRRKTSKK